MWPAVILRPLIAASLGLATTVTTCWGLAWRLDLRDGEERAASRLRVPANGEGAGVLSLDIKHRRGGAEYYSLAREYMPHDGDDRTPLGPEQLAPPWILRECLPWVIGAAPWPGVPRDPSRGRLDRNDYRRLRAFGWPVLALFYVDHAATNAQGAQLEVPRGGIRLPGGQLPNSDIPLALPLRPIWSGLALNTGLFALLWSLLLFAPGIARRALRRRRGLCPRCAYDLRNLPPGSPCPECGDRPAQRHEPVPA